MAWQRWAVGCCRVESHGAGSRAR